MAVVALVCGIMWSMSVTPAGAQLRSTTAVVRAVRDGETIEVAGIGRVGLLGVDVPARPRDGSATGVDLIARRRLAELVLHRWVRLEDEAVSRVTPGNRRAGKGKGRLYVFREDGLFVNAQLVREGLARVRAADSIRRGAELQQAEAEARAWRRGLWAVLAGPDGGDHGRERPRDGLYSRSTGGRGFNASGPSRVRQFARFAAACDNRRVDFASEIEEIGTFLKRAGFPFAVVEGVALAGYGHPRMTLDLDVMTDAAAQDAVVKFMGSRGFSTLHRSSGYSNHVHTDRHHGRVDFVYVRGGTATRVFAELRTVPGPGGRPIDVPRPEHLIAMKVQAMRDAPERTWQELVDIGYLMKLKGVDREEVRRHFERNGLEERWRELERTL